MQSTGLQGKGQDAICNAALRVDPSQYLLMCVKHGHPQGKCNDTNRFFFVIMHVCMCCRGAPANSHHDAGQGRAGQGRAGQGRAGQGRAGQGRAGQGMAWQGRAGQGRAPCTCQ